MRRISIHRFRGIREGVLEDLGSVNLLLGPNNSGKTAVLELLYLGGMSGRPCALIMETVDPSAFSASTLLRHDFLGYEPLSRLHRRRGHQKYHHRSPSTLTEENGIAITLQALPKEHPLHDFRLGALFDELNGSSEVFSQEDVGSLALFSLANQIAIPVEMIPTLFEAKRVHSEETRWHYLWQPEWVHRWNPDPPIDHLAVWADEGTPPIAEHVLFCDFHSANAHFTDRFATWAWENIPDWYEKIAAGVARVFPQFDKLRVSIQQAPGSLNNSAGYLGQLMVDHFGDGTRHVFKTLASLIALCEVVDEEHPGLFLWEYPELFMHPESLRRLLDEVMRLIAGKPIQMFLSSQSLEVVTQMTHNFHTKYANVQNTLRAFRLKLDDGRLYSATFHFRNLYTWLEQGMDPRCWDPR